MSQLKIIIRQKKKLKLSYKFKLNRSKALDKKKEFISSLNPQKNISFFKNIPRDSSINRLTNRCWSTGRSAAVSRYFGLTRHALRKFGHNCLLPGFIKMSW